MGLEGEAGDLTGQVLGDQYRVSRLVGRGGMGSVYEARHLRLENKRFAVKVMHPEVAGDPQAFARFRREAEIATALQHPNIADVVDFNTTAEGRPYMVMEYLEGEDLARRLERRQRLDPAEVVDLMTQVGSALTAAHRRGIVHRDMKPENVFLVPLPDGGELAKVLDFGISKIRHSKSIVTASQAVFGTPYYMSPEQADGRVEDINQTTDTFALGVMIYVMLSGELAFDGPSPAGVLYQVVHAEPRPITQARPDLPGAMEPFMARALDKRPAHRFADVDSLLAGLAAALDQEPPEPRTTVALALDHRRDQDPEEADTAIPTLEPEPPTATWAADETGSRWRWFALAGALAVMFFGVGVALRNITAGDLPRPKPAVTPLPVDMGLPDAGAADRTSPPDGSPDRSGGGLSFPDLAPTPDLPPTPDRGARPPRPKPPPRPSTSTRRPARERAPPASKPTKKPAKKPALPTFQEL